MKGLLNRIKGHILDRKIEKKEAAMEAKRQAMKETYRHITPAITVAAMTAVALSGQFSFM